MVRPGAQLTVVSVAGEVVTFAVVSVDPLVHVISRVTFALATDAVSSVVTEGGGGVVRSAARLQVPTEGKVLGGALALTTKEVRGTFTDTTLVSSHSVTQWTVLLISKVPRLLTVALAQHLQVHDDALVDANWIDLESLPPFPWVLGALDNLNLGSEHDSGSNLETRAFVGLAWRSVSETAGEVRDLHVTRGIVLHLDGAGDGLVLGLHQLNNIAGVVAKPPG